MHKILLSIIFLLSVQFIYSQKGNISGTLIDTAGSEQNVGYATISVFKLGDSIITTYQLSDEEGKFIIKNLALNTTYKLVINAFQYTVLRKEVLLKTKNPDINLGKIILSSQGNNLDEFVISGEIPPIFVRNDTVEFNASSFKTLPTAVVEDLLKKLPGVTVGSDGSILVNGKQVSKILVDGREFFGGNQQIATKNLPANIIDKVQVSDDKEALRRDPNLTAANTPQIINLKLKKEIKKGAFGKLYAGAGPNQLFETGGIMNLFKDTMQISILAYGNNVNKPGFGFEDMNSLGGFERSGVQSIMMGNEGEFEINGISFGGSGGGQQTSSGGGFNFNTIAKKGITVNSSYFYGQSKNYTKEISDIAQNLGDEKLLILDSSTQNNSIYNHNFSSKIYWKIDTLSSLHIRPSVKLSQTRNNGFQTKKSTNEEYEAINNSQNLIKNYGTKLDYNLNVDYYKSFKKKGRSLYTNFAYSKTNNESDFFNNANNVFYIQPSSTSINQLRNNNIENSYYFLRYNYTEPISKKLNIKFSGSSTYLDNKNALSTFYKDSLNDAYLIEVPSLTETVNQKGFKNYLQGGLQWLFNKDLTISSGLSSNFINLNNTFTKYKDFNQNYQFFAPYLYIRIKSMSINYSSRFTAPNIRYIQPITDNTDPLFIQNGNPQILPTTSQNLYLHLYKYDTKKSIYYNVYFNGDIEKNGVIMSRTIDSNGIQISTPTNVDGIIHLYHSASINKSYKSSKNQFSIGGHFGVNYNRNIVSVNGIQSFANIITLNPSINGRINLNDKFEISQSYNLTYNKSTYDDDFYRDIDFITHNLETEFIIRLPKKFVWETNYKLQYNTQRVAGFNNYIQLWNAGLTYLFLKNDRGQLKLSVNDLLNTNNRRYVYITGNSVNDVLTNNLGRHGLITFTYNIQNFGQKVGGRERFFGF